MVICRVKYCCFKPLESFKMNLGWLYFSNFPWTMNKLLLNFKKQVEKNKSATRLALTRQKGFYEFFGGSDVMCNINWARIVEMQVLNNRVNLESELPLCVKGRWKNGRWAAQVGRVANDWYLNCLSKQLDRLPILYCTTVSSASKIFVSLLRVSPAGSLLAAALSCFLRVDYTTNLIERVCVFDSSVSEPSELRAPW